MSVKSLSALSALLGLLVLSGCASAPAAPVMSAVIVPAPQQKFSQCVPYARHRSGLDLYGDAWTWWDNAAGRYQRGPAPRPGAVLVLRRTDRLRHGHVAVVRDLLDGRRITVDHANWLSENDEPELDMGVTDISPANDWSLVRFWNAAANSWGRPYPAYGFVYRAPGARNATAAAY